MPREKRTFDGRRKNKNSKEVADNRADKNKNTDNVNLSMPNGLRLTAGGQFTILVVGLVTGLIYCCDKLTRLAICICERLNRQPDPARVK